MFYLFFYKIIIFRPNKEKEIVNFYNLETANHIARVIFLLHSAMKTLLLTNQKHILTKLLYKNVKRQLKIQCC